MFKDSLRGLRCTFTIVSIGILTSLYAIFSGILSFNIGLVCRIQLGPVAAIMAGLWFGPAAGMLCGFTGDILGCLAHGYTINPLILLSCSSYGIIPSLFLSAAKVSKKAKIMELCVGTSIAVICCTGFLTTSGLVLIMGYNILAIFPARLFQTVLFIPVYSLLVCLIYFSPVTGTIKHLISMRTFIKPTKADLGR